MDASNTLCRLSRRFYLRHFGVEFVAGLAWHPNNEHLIISFSVNDNDQFLAVVSAGDVRTILLDIAEHERTSREAIATGQTTLAKLVLSERDGLRNNL
jgi:exonuclease I